MRSKCREAKLIHTASLASLWKARSKQKHYLSLSQGKLLPLRRREESKIALARIISIEQVLVCTRVIADLTFTTERLAPVPHEAIAPLFSLRPVHVDETW